MVQNMPTRPSSAAELLDWSPALVKTMATLGDRIVAMQETMPKHSSGMPLAYIDPQVITAMPVPGEGPQAPAKRVQNYMDEELRAQEKQEREQKALLAAQGNLTVETPPDEAIVPISYLEGFPTVLGLPIWERLDGEPIPYYELFKSYRQLKETEGRRSLQEVARRANLEVRTIHTLSRVFHWTLRTTSYDANRARELEVTKQRLEKDLEGRHSRTAKDIFQICESYLKDNREQLTPKTALEWMELAVKLERLSIGLHPDKPSIRPEDANNSEQGTLLAVQSAVERVESASGGGEHRFREILTILARSGALPTAATPSTGTGPMGAGPLGTGPMGTGPLGGVMGDAIMGGGVNLNGGGHPTRRI